MTICDKIQTIGDTLETNLNNRGVSCTFGTGTGEKTILDMANLITANNLKGSADNIITIKANRPYLLDDEKTDLVVRLTNGLGQPQVGKQVSVTDGTATYQGVTDSDGVMQLYDIEVSGDTTFTATYSTVSATCEVCLSTFVDYGADNNYTDWDAVSNLTVTRATETTLTLTSQGSIGSRYVAISSPTAIEFDLYTNNANPTANMISLRDGSTILVGFTKQELGINSEKYYHIKLAISGSTVTPYVNGVAKTSETLDSTPNRFYFGLPNSTTNIFRYKNFSIR